MQKSIKADSVKQAAKKFLKQNPKQSIYDVTRESVSYKNGLYRVTSVKKGTFPKSKLSKYNKYKR